MNNRNSDAFEATKIRIAKKFIMLRTGTGVDSVEAFAKEYKVSRVQYWRIENGIGNPTLRTLVDFCATHNMTIEEFFTHKKETPC